MVTDVKDRIFWHNTYLLLITENDAKADFVRNMKTRANEC